MCKNKNDNFTEFDDMSQTVTDCDFVDGFIDVPDDSDDTSSDKTFKEMLLDNLYAMTPREQKVIKLRYGLEDGVCRSVEELSEQFYVSPERIAQIEQKALRVLKRPKRILKLRDFLPDSE